MERLATKLVRFIKLLESKGRLTQIEVDEANQALKELNRRIEVDVAQHARVS
jgi:hypothetical protein